MLLWDIRNTGQHCRGAIIFPCGTSFHPLKHLGLRLPPFKPTEGCNSDYTRGVAGETRVSPLGVAIYNL